MHGDIRFTIIRAAVHFPHPTAGVRVLADDGEEAVAMEVFVSTHPSAIEIPFCDQGGAATGQFKRGELNELAFENARRIQQSLTASAEKKLLIWIAVRLPAWINSDHLTAMGSAGMLLAGLSYAAARRHPAGLLLATFFLGVNWLGDSLDGTLARVRNRQRLRYGFYLDHVVDTIGAAFLMTGLAVSGYMHAVIALGLLVSFLMLSTEVYLAAYTLGRFQLSFWRFGPTEIRILLAAGNLALFAHPFASIGARTYRLFDVGGVVASAGMVVMMVISAVRHTAQLYREERLP